MAEPNVIQNADLTPEERASILARYINRDTKDSPWNEFARRSMGKGSATETDEEWINNRMWQRMPDGRVVILESIPLLVNGASETDIQRFERSAR